MLPQNHIHTILAVEDPEKVEDDVVAFVEENHSDQIFLILYEGSLEESIHVGDGFLLTSLIEDHLGFKTLAVWVMEGVLDSNILDMGVDVVDRTQFLLELRDDRDGLHAFSLIIFECIDDYLPIHNQMTTSCPKKLLSVTS